MPKNLGKLACLGLLVSFVTLSACRSDEFGRDYATERRAALRAKSGVRFTPGRLVDVPWSPVREPPQGQVANPAVPAGPAQFRGEGVTVYSPLESASRGFALLVDRGEGQNADSVLRRFEQAWEAGQRDPAFLNDYAAALLERGLPRDLILGGEYAARALEAAELDDPAGDLAQAARFNWALALKRLALHGQATQAWQALLDHETDSHWRAEAEAHLEDLAQWPVARWPQVRQEVRAAAAAGDVETIAELLPDFRTAIRLLAEDEELKTWAETVEIDPPRAAEALTVARTIGAALAPTDRFLADVVAGIDGVRGDVPKRAELAAAVRGFYEGLRAYQEFAYDRARPLLEAAANTLSKTRHPLAFRAGFFAVASSDQLGLAQLLDLQDTFIAQLPVDYQALASQARYNRGKAQAWAGYPEASLEDLKEAVSSLAALGELDLEPSYRSMLGDALSRAHRQSEADLEDSRWLDRADQIVGPYYRYFASVAAGYRATLEGALRVGLAVTRESAGISNELRRESLSAEARTELFKALGQLGRFGEAERAKGAAAKAIAQIGDADNRRRCEADLQWAEAGLPPRLWSQSRVQLLEAALKGLEGPSEGGASTQLILQATEIRRDLARQYLVLGRFSEARESAERAYDLLAQRSALVEETRLDFAAEVRPTVDRWLLASLGEFGTVRPEELFAWIEKGHHLSAPGAWGQPATAEQIGTAIPADTSLVEISPLDDRVLVLVSRRGDVEAKLFAVPNLDGLLACLDPRFGTCAVSWDESAEQLVAAAVEPWLCRLPAGERLVLVPGKMARVPFAALPIRCSGEAEQRWVDRHVTSLAPSATFWLKAQGRAADLSAGGPARTVLTVGLKSASGFTTELPWAEAEAVELAGLYETSKTLLGVGATQEAIQEAAQEADVLHFATHGAIDKDYPNGSYLALAASRLAVKDLAGSADRLPRTRLAVLAACETGGHLDGIEGLVGASRAFLEIGIPSVVATLSDVDDEYARGLMVNFHRFYQSTGDAALALALAQREAPALTRLESERAKQEPGKKKSSPPEWARWVVLGE